jgi:EF hand
MDTLKAFDMSVTRIAVFVAAVAALTVTGAFAQGPAASRDAPVTRVEMQEEVQRRFAQMDANHDGVLTEDELDPRSAAAMKRLDTNHDGKITLAEAMAPKMAAFDAADTNHDGILTPEEREAARARRQH